jgi:hypothetical protein
LVKEALELAVAVADGRDACGVALAAGVNSPSDAHKLASTVTETPKGARRSHRDFSFSISCLRKGVLKGAA